MQNDEKKFCNSTKQYVRENVKDIKFNFFKREHSTSCIEYTNLEYMKNKNKENKHSKFF